MKLRKHLGQNESGAAVIEMAIALPVLISIIWGIVQFGLLFQASAGMQHALGEAARLATLFPTPADSEITAKVAAKKFGTSRGTLSALQIDNMWSNGQSTCSTSGPNASASCVLQYKTLTLTYSQPMNFLFFQGPPVTLTRSKRVYIPN